MIIGLSRIFLQRLEVQDERHCRDNHQH